MTEDLLFSSYPLAGLDLNNRIAMAPMTRSRATNPGQVPTASMAGYYAQRASAGLIITEGTPVSPVAHGYPFTPGIHTQEQVEGWKSVVRAVHDKNGRMFVQLWHCGRIGHHSIHADGDPPVGPSGIPANMKVSALDDKGQVYFTECDRPRTLSTDETYGVVSEFATAARRAREAGFDGVEIHGANGYLLDQYLSARLNDRRDEFGGTLENRSRLLLQCAAAAAEVIGAARVGVRLSPLGTFNDMQPDADPSRTYGYIAEQLTRLGIGYLHLYDQTGAWIHDTANPLLAQLRERFAGTLIVCGGYDREKADQALAAGRADMVAFGKAYISNPDLAERLKAGHPLAPFDVKTFYAGGEKGYTDYPRYDAAASGSAS